MNVSGTNNPNYKHGKRHTRIYHIFLDMKQRCLNPKCRHYKNYGARGVTICSEWLEDFMTFYNWSMENGYTETLTIDRIDVNGNYCPENCRWVTLSEQQNNRRSCRMITYKGKTQNLKAWAKEYNMNYDKLRYRLDNWKDLDKIFES